MASPDWTKNNSTSEQELAKILTYLNPPQQEYDILADRAKRLLSTLPPQPSIVRALAVYFAYFAHGYAEWQGCYNYPKIHEYFYGAYLQAKREGSTLSPQLSEMLEQMTEAMIAYTHWENAFISNNPQGLLVSATSAYSYSQQALHALERSPLSRSLLEPIEQYLDMNSYLFFGFKLCAEMYLAPLRGEEIPVDHLNKANRTLKHLEEMSRELASELRAHFSFAQRLKQAYAQRKTNLRVKKGTLLLRATGHLGEDLTSQM